MYLPKPANWSKSKEGDPATGEFGDAKVIKKFRRRADRPK
jgi:hypothetical protein